MQLGVTCTAKLALVWLTSYKLSHTLRLHTVVMLFNSHLSTHQNAFSQHNTSTILPPLTLIQNVPVWVECQLFFQGWYQLLPLFSLWHVKCLWPLPESLNKMSLKSRPPSGIQTFMSNTLCAREWPSLLVYVQTQMAALVHYHGLRCQGSGQAILIPDHQLCSLTLQPRHPCNLHSLSFLQQLSIMPAPLMNLMNSMTHAIFMAVQAIQIFTICYFYRR